MRQNREHGTGCRPSPDPDYPISTSTCSKSLPASRHTLELWRLDYNTQRPHTSLDGLTPFTFANQSAMEHNRDRLWL